MANWPNDINLQIEKIQFETTDQYNDQKIGLNTPNATPNATPMQLDCDSPFNRLYGSNRCCKCKQNVAKLDYVMKVNSKIFHVNCFRCEACSRQLVQGEHFTILKEETLLCKNDFEQIELLNSNTENNFNKSNCRPTTPMTALCAQSGAPTGAQPPTQGFGGLVSNLMAPNCDSSNLMSSDLNSSNCSSISPNSNSNSSSGDFGGSAGATHLHHLGAPGSHLAQLGQAIADSQSTNGSMAGGGQAGGHAAGSLHHSSQANAGSHSSERTVRHSSRNPDQAKQTRVRTVLNDKQLQTLRAVYNQNPRPDSLMKEQLVQNTGLNPRVIRVWWVFIYFDL